MYRAYLKFLGMQVRLNVMRREAKHYVYWLPAGSHEHKEVSASHVWLLYAVAGRGSVFFVEGRSHRAGRWFVSLAAPTTTKNVYAYGSEAWTYLADYGIRPAPGLYPGLPPAVSLAEFIKIAQACTTNAEAPVEIKVLKTSPPHHTRIEVVGSLQAVASYVAHRLRSDRVTPLYEHMALRVDAAWTDGETVTARLAKNHYAGD